MARSHPLVCYLLLATLSGGAAAQVLVVVGNPDSATEALSRREVVDLYMGRTQHFPDGSPVVRVDLEPESHGRSAFYRHLVGKSVAEINAYWARLRFTGRATPPTVVEDDSSVKRLVRENRNAIGYISADSVDDTVKVLAHVE